MIIVVVKVVAIWMAVTTIGLMSWTYFHQSLRDEGWSKKWNGYN